LSAQEDNLMANESGQFLWLIIDVVLVLALAGALIYGIYMWSRHRGGPASERVRDRGTERVYREAEAQDRKELPS
jgi:hypothetical protein